MQSSNNHTGDNHNSNNGSYYSKTVTAGLK